MDRPWLALALLCIQGEENPFSWFYFDSRETEHGGPVLELIDKEGHATKLPVAEDDVLISYLADRPWGALPQLSIDRADRNRVLLRFELGRGPEFERAVLRLDLRQSEMGTTTPLELAVHRVTEAWDEETTTWNDQPAYAEEPALTLAVGPAEGPVTIDVTPLARAWKDGTPNYGLLLRAAKPMAAPGEPSAPDGNASRVDAELVALYRWAGSLESALGEAERTGNAVFALIGAAFGPEELVEHERLLLATCLSHPDVRVAVERGGFVPLRVRVSPNDVAVAVEDAPDGPVSPLAELGLALPDIAPPALAVIRPGAEPHVLARMGVFDHESVLQLLGAKAAPRNARLSSALADLRAGSLGNAAAALAELEEPEARYWRAAILWSRGEPESARELLRELAENEEAPLWAAKARFRLAYPDLVGGYEALAAPRAGHGEAELVKGAVKFLIATQLPDGSWPMGHPSYEEHREGITVLCAHALFERGEDAAVDSAHAWLAEHVAKRAPAMLNSFTATYWLEYQLARQARGKSTREDVAAAIALLAGGQMENGAWSYSKSWGEGWRGGFGGWPATTQGRAHGMNTAIALEVLTRAKELGFEVKDEVLSAGREALLEMRVAPGRFTYTWPEPRNFEELDASIARAPAAETALWRMGATEREDLATSVRAFVERRMTLDVPVKMTESWLPPHGLSAYFHSFAYLHGARAVRALGAESRDHDLAALRADVIARVEPDGTWMDTLALGKPYSTAMALLILGVTGE